MLSSPVMRIREWVGCALLLTVVALVPMAYASPPDQTWLAGFYDDADYDDVVTLATVAVGAIVKVGPVSFGPPTSVVAFVTHTPELPPPAHVAPSYRLRAPPIA